MLLVKKPNNFYILEVIWAVEHWKSLEPLLSYPLRLSPLPPYALRSVSFGRPAERTERDGRKGW